MPAGRSDRPPTSGRQPATEINLPGAPPAEHLLLAADTGTLKLRIIDSEGAAIAGAQVFVRSDASGRQQPISSASEMSSADQMGRFTKELQPGFFDVCVMSDAFVPVCQKMRVVVGVTKNVTVKMKFDSNVTREIGDSFPTRSR
jgi:hypothetical protein